MLVPRTLLLRWYLQSGRNWLFNLKSSVAATSSAVPEPATWAMMITGFSLAGAAIRRRRQALAAA